MSKLYFTIVQIAFLIFCGLFSSKVKSQQTIATDTLLTNNPKYGLIHVVYLHPYVENNHTYHTTDSEAVFLTDRTHHSLMLLKSDFFYFIHEDIIDTIKIQEIALDSNVNGVLLSRRYTKNCSYLNADFHWTVNGEWLQIWNLKNKDLIFDLYTYYHYSSQETTNAGLENEKETDEDCGCSNTFKILGKGLIKINEGLQSDDFQTRCDGEECKIERGTFQYKKGKFLRIKRP